MAENHQEQGEYLNVRTWFSKTITISMIIEEEEEEDPIRSWVLYLNK